MEVTLGLLYSWVASFWVGAGLDELGLSSFEGPNWEVGLGGSEPEPRMLGGASLGFVMGSLV
jgi:hypothetical protein